MMRAWILTAVLAAAVSAFPAACAAQGDNAFRLDEEIDDETQGTIVGAKRAEVEQTEQTLKPPALAPQAPPGVGLQDRLTIIRDQVRVLATDKASAEAQKKPAAQIAAIDGKIRKLEAEAASIRKELQTLPPQQQ